MDTNIKFPELKKIISKIEGILGREFTLIEHSKILEVICEDRVEVSKWVLQVSKEEITNNEQLSL